MTQISSKHHWQGGINLLTQSSDKIPILTENYMNLHVFTFNIGYLQSIKGGKDQESIQSSTTCDPG